MTIYKMNPSLSSPTEPRTLHLKSAALVTLDLVRAVRGCDTPRVWREVEDGRWLWVWDIATRPSARGHIRELRFWVDEISAPDRARKLSAQQVAGKILGERRQSWTISALSGLFMCCGEHVHNLIAANQLQVMPGGTPKQIPRASVASFLNQRRVA